MKTTKVTLLDFEKFKEYCEIWRHKLGLTNWAVYYHMTSDIPDSYGDCSWETEGAVGVIRISKKWDSESRPLNDKELDKLALHEILHLWLGQYSDAANDRFTTSKELDRLEHMAIRQLEDLLCV